MFRKNGAAAMENTMFTAPPREKVSKQIVQQIRSAIMQGRLKPGQPLPQEKDLVAQFGVSKHTLREALRALEALGLIAIRRGAGGGPVVSEIDWATARDYFASFLYFQNFSLGDISEVRKLVEPYIAGQVATKIRPEEMEEMWAVHETCVGAFQKNKNIVRNEAEVMFHVLLAKFAGNPFLWALMDFVNNMLADAKHKLKPGREFAAQVLEAHQEILEAIEAGDVEGASAAMRKHICEVEDGLSLLETE